MTGPTSPDDIPELPLEELLAQAQRTNSGDEAYWDAVSVLQERGSPVVFAAAQTLCASTHPQERALGVDILAQGRTGQKTFPEETIELLLALLARETNDEDEETRLEAMMGLARRKDERVLDPLREELAHQPVASLALEAAEEFGDSRLCEVLQWLKTAGAGGQELEKALRACGCTVAP